MVGRIIHSPGCVAEGAAWLAARDPSFARALPLVGELPLRREADGFAALLRAIVGQTTDQVVGGLRAWLRGEPGGAEYGRLMGMDAIVREVMAKW